MRRAIKLKVYIAGPITGVPDYKDNFRRAAELLELKYFEPVDPTEEGEVEGYAYRDYIDRGLRKLLRSDAIALLPGWQTSKGAVLEQYYASICGLRIFYISDDYRRLEL